MSNAPNTAELAKAAAEEVMLVIERNRRIIKADIVEAIEKILAPKLGIGGYGPEYGVPVFAIVDSQATLDRMLMTQLSANAMLGFPALFGK